MKYYNKYKAIFIYNGEIKFAMIKAIDSVEAKQEIRDEYRGAHSIDIELLDENIPEFMKY